MHSMPVYYFGLPVVTCILYLSIEERVLLLKDHYIPDAKPEIRWHDDVYYIYYVTTTRTQRKKSKAY